MEVSGMAGGEFDMNIPGETRVVMGGAGDAALGAVMGKLLSAVARAMGRVGRFKPMLQDLHSTLESIRPKINEINRLNQQLNNSQNRDTIKLREALEKGQTLVEKCENVARWNCWKKNRYAKRLQKLDHALLRLCQIEFQVEQLRDSRMILAEVRQLHQRLDSLDSRMTCTTISPLRYYQDPPSPYRI